MKSIRKDLCCVLLSFQDTCQCLPKILETTFSSSTHERECGDTLVTLCVTATIVHIAQSAPSSFQADVPSATSGSRLSGRTVVGTARGKRYLFYCWAVCGMWPGYGIIVILPGSSPGGSREFKVGMASARIRKQLLN